MVHYSCHVFDVLSSLGASESGGGRNAMSPTAPKHTTFSASAKADARVSGLEWCPATWSLKWERFCVLFEESDYGAIALQLSGLDAMFTLIEGYAGKNVWVSAPRKHGATMKRTLCLSHWSHEWKRFCASLEESDFGSIVLQLFGFDLIIRVRDDAQIRPTIKPYAMRRFGI